MSSAEIELELIQLEKKINLLEKRVEAVAAAKEFYEKNFEEALEAYNNKIAKMEDLFAEGYSGFSNRDQLALDIARMKEGSIDTDSASFEIRNFLTKEITRCNNALISLNSAIKTQKQKLEEALEQERLEKGDDTYGYI